MTSIPMQMPWASAADNAPKPASELIDPETHIQFENFETAGFVIYIN